MKSDQTKEEALFNVARRLTDTEQRATFLDAACKGDPELRRDVEALLAAQTKAGAFFDRGI